MKNIITASGVMFLLLSFSYLPDNKKVFKKLYALEGVWKMKTKKGFICEEWKKVDKNYLQSRGYMIKGTDTIINERVALKRTKDDINYISTVEDQNDKKPVAFKLTSATGNVFIFENPEHDFPKRIVYHLVTTDSLHGFVDDGIVGTKKIKHFYYSKY
jgi:hypothetical protein